MKQHHQASRELYRRSQTQHGLLTRADVRAGGFSDPQIRVRLRSGEWIRVYPGVYRLAGAPVTAEQQCLAAVLACGASAFASHQSAAWLWRLLDRPPERHAVSVGAMSSPRPPRVDVHRTRPVAPERLHVRSGIWCTDPLRTLVDLAAVTSGPRLTAAVDCGLASRLVTVEGLEAELAREGAKGRKGIATLRRELERRGFLGAPRPSVLESRTRRLLASAGIYPLSMECATGDGWYRLDIMVTPEVAVEVSGYRYHWSPEHLASDEARRNRIALSGTVVLTYTWWDVTRDGARIIREVRQAIAPAA